MEIIHKDKIILIDDDDYEVIKGKSINLNSEGYPRIGEVRLHTIILERKLGRPRRPGMVTDHINRNRLDSRKSNLREATMLENVLNKDRGHRKCFGSTWMKSRNKWQAQIKINGKQTYLGLFDSEEEAQECYLKKAKELQKL